LPRLGVVYDSNLYRTLPLSRFEALRDREANWSIQAYASYYVAWELLAHLADPKDPSFDYALGALKRLWAHCKTYDGSREGLGFLADAEAQVPYLLFKERPRRLDQERNLHAQTIGEVTHQPVASWSERLRASIHAIAGHVQEVEDQFVANMWSIVVTLNPAAKQWSDVKSSAALRTALLASIDRGESLTRSAEAIAQRAADEIGRSITITELRESTEKVQRHLPLPVHLYSRLVRRLVEGGPDMTKTRNVNSIWDFHICFSVGLGASLRGAGLWLITADSEVLQAAEAASATWCVRHPDQYEALLTRNDDQLLEELEAEPIPQ